MKGCITIDKERCKGCALCVDVCPTGSISLGEELNLKGYFVATFNPAGDCTGCGHCALMCPDLAIEVTRS